MSDTGGSNAIQSINNPLEFRKTLTVREFAKALAVRNPQKDQSTNDLTEEWIRAITECIKVIPDSAVQTFDIDGTPSYYDSRIKSEIETFTVKVTLKGIEGTCPLERYIYSDFSELEGRTIYFYDCAKFPKEAYWLFCKDFHGYEIPFPFNPPGEVSLTPEQNISMVTSGEKLPTGEVLPRVSMGIVRRLIFNNPTLGYVFEAIEEWEGETNNGLKLPSDKASREESLNLLKERLNAKFKRHKLGWVQDKDHQYEISPRQFEVLEDLFLQSRISGKRHKK